MSIQSDITQKVREGLRPTHLEVANESHRHRNKPNAETHFKIVAISPLFEGKSLVERHRQLYELLAQELKAGVHALALHLFTPKEWEKKQEAEKSPACAGGSKSD
jgi:BolA family transcriptional regulator, general stress-responsive regulator